MAEVLSKGSGAKGYTISCLLRGSSIPNSKFRRNIHADSNEMREIKHLIVKLLEGSHSSQDVAAYLNSASKVVCKYAKCFGVLSRIVKLRKDLVELEQTVTAALNSTMQQQNTHSHFQSVQGLPEARKRQCLHQAAGTPPTKRTNTASGPNKEVQCTPARKFMDQPAEDTPVLAVSYN